MKDYYYFLGVDQNANAEQIKRAYRALSLKYHPDKNIGDEFFHLRFTELKEAYETLMDPSLRKLYDESYSKEKRGMLQKLPPEIVHFSVSKVRAYKDDKLIVQWRTKNADVVKLLPFGLVSEYGEKTFSVGEFTDGKFELLLHISNSLLRSTAVKGITISELSEVESKEPFKTKIEKRREQINKHKEENAKADKFKIILWVVFLVVILGVIIYKIIG